MNSLLATAVALEKVTISSEGGTTGRALCPKYESRCKQCTWGPSLAGEAFPGSVDGRKHFFAHSDSSDERRKYRALNGCFAVRQTLHCNKLSHHDTWRS